MLLPMQTGPLARIGRENPTYPSHSTPYNRDIQQFLRFRHYCSVILPAVKNGTFHMLLHSAVIEIIRLTPSRAPPRRAVVRGRGQVGNLVLEAPDCGETRVFTMHATPDPALAASEKGEPEAARPRRRLGVKQPKCNRDRYRREFVSTRLSPGR